MGAHVNNDVVSNKPALGFVAQAAAWLLLLGPVFGSGVAQAQNQPDLNSSYVVGTAYGPELFAEDIRKFDIYGFKLNQTLAEVAKVARARPGASYSERLNLPDGGAGAIDDQNAPSEDFVDVDFHVMVDQMAEVEIDFCRQESGEYRTYKITTDMNGFYETPEQMSNFIVYTKKKFSYPTLNDGQLMYWGTLRPGSSRSMPPIGGTRAEEDTHTPYVEFYYPYQNGRKVEVIFLDPFVHQACDDRAAAYKNKVQSAGNAF